MPQSKKIKISSRMQHCQSAVGFLDFLILGNGEELLHLYMSRKWKFRDKHSLYFISFAVVNWIDVFVRIAYKQTLMKSWKYCQKNKGIEIYGWCIMPSHVHMIIGTAGDNHENIVRDMKRHTSEVRDQQIMKHPQESRREWMLPMMEIAGKANSNNAGWQLWQQNNKPIEQQSIDMGRRALT